MHVCHRLLHSAICCGTLPQPIIYTQLVAEQKNLAKKVQNKPTVHHQHKNEAQKSLICRWLNSRRAETALWQNVRIPRKEKSLLLQISIQPFVDFVQQSIAVFNFLQHTTHAAHHNHLCT